MATDKVDAAKVFRRECRNIPGYEKELKRLRQDMEVVETQMMNIHSPDLTSPTTRTIIMDDRIIRNLDEKERIELQINEIMKMMEWIRKCIMAVKDPAYRAFISMIYLEGIRLNKVATRANISDIRMSLSITRMLNEAITDQMMREHDRIKEQIDW